MSAWKHTVGRIEGLHLFERPVFGDTRGCFTELWHQSRYKEAGINTAFVQDNFSRSIRHTLRGLHYQVQHPQAKLVTCLRGEIWDVAVDLRPGSPTHGQWECAVLSEENGCQIYVPRGFAHGFLVLSDTADVVYKCDEFYDSTDEFGVHWDDPSLSIDWPCKEAPLVSEKDQQLPFWDNLPEDQRP